jgi:thiol:disulfide interchange protein DsbD
MGLTLGVVAAPCLGPFILGLLTYVGQTGDPLLGFLYFFVLSIGMGLPLSILAVFSTAINKLPVSGDWMVWVRKLMGWVLIVMAAYLISPLLPQRLERFALIALVVMAAGVHLGWLDRAGQGSRRFGYLKKGIGLVFVLAGLTYLLWPTPEAEGIRWSPYSEERVAAAVRENRPLILDFSADWCGPCQAMERKVFRDPEVIALSQAFVTLRMDLTYSQPSQEAVLKRYQVRGVPTIVFLTKGGSEVKGLRAESFVDTGPFLSKMKRLLEVSTGLDE